MVDRQHPIASVVDDALTEQQGIAQLDLEAVCERMGWTPAQALRELAEAAHHGLVTVESVEVRR